jgi:DNA-binding MarR family transcriptional regulator
LSASRPTHLLDLGRSLKQVQYKHHRAADQRLSDLGITLVQWDALRAIARTPEVPAHALAKATFQTDQAFSTLANRLAQKGWIERVPGPGRALHHHLTEAGKAMLEQGYSPVVDVVSASFAGFSTEEQVLLQSLLTRIIET